MRLANKVAIITGGAGGIGLAAVKRFLEEGAKVAIVDYDKQQGEKMEAELGENVAFFAVDVSKLAEVKEMVEQVVDRFGKIDILINNAGITRDATLVKMSEEDFEKVIQINLNGVYYCTQAVAPHMIAQGSGKIISTSSVSGVYGNFGQTNYAATKAAIIGMTKTWAKELGRKGINVNAVAPGFTATPMVEKMPEKVLQQMEGITSLQRLGKPEDIANAYLFLASDEASYITGHVLQVDGGIMM
ncbi:3-oxoacyl-[acyl-carrier protein] reductase [Solibacillus kalamii]|uniref:3-oxoacyl-[acyl-carrier-protein] reductase FabG n=2 Tax=Solibacillus TaxID=648800 RepID=K1L2W9_9BACL|nr:MULTISPECIES: 3-oxoacyl-ACP reductase FabG [Solibacillus]AMO84058.1 beta-ketoacyl-ACP reductase [Solibacillus silvestris]EKB44993.1 3-oxoacyl-[acyl-carrier-protein] reductase FabG [Solibacillus isronensis B3W22]MBM7665464.1 3-oxoacyl-[acyl-carrier protein] reductase [Solibacillus kalamii]OUZ39290.1 3-oxoacyl-ACP reductase [Solibacillus kalamii]